ncbi:hypothetical protein LF65_04810 [Clostridium beijerinckii]|uniref:Uncharacterized protein n=1 Tax=Clostridium beijerinckii TaxID=1520 RepID=A0A0B5QWI5_CLOBE|nr:MULTISPECIES: hypothetical protein [Clostridium]AJH01339.1 hypothetical protein LF65_04810 [Clostridium beijerinckii]OVE70739.1 hypothetical protein CCS79_01835 [Clostridium diolis]
MNDVLIDNIQVIKNEIDNIWAYMNLADFKKGNDKIIELISKIEFVINNYTGKKENLNKITFILNETIKAMEKQDYVLEADILKYDLKESFIKLEAEL